MMITGETVIAPPQLPALPGDANDALRKAYAAAKTPVELRPAIDQTILNAARENARQSMPFYKKIPWYTQFSMAGAVFGSLFLSTVVIYKTVVHKHDKGIEELVTAEVAVKTEEARKKAPMVVSILAENGGTVSVAAPAMVAAAPMINTPPAVDSAQPTLMASAQPAKKEAVASNIIVAEAKRDTEASSRTQDKIVMADAASLSKDMRSRRAEQQSEPAAGAAAGSAAGLVVGASAKAAPTKAKEADTVVAALAPPSPAMPAAAAPAAAPARTLAPANAAAPAPVESAQAWQTRIEVLQRAGKTALAKTELQALLKRYPETVLTADLKRLLSD